MILAEINAIEVIVDFFKFIIPAAIVFGVTYFLISKFFEDQRRTRLLDLKKGSNNFRENKWI